ncbi:kinase-like domain-containing protein [Aspergillus oleicola]
MIDPEDRFFSESQSYFGSSENPKTEAHCRVWDWDQLRLIKVKGTAKILLPEQEIEISIVRKLIDSLSPKVCAITVDDDGLVTGLSTDLEDDDTLFYPHLPFSMFDSIKGCRTIQYSKLQELDRLGPGVDLSSYEDETGATHKVSFKFNPLEKPLRLQMAWDELHLLQKLHPHPNVVPFDRVVLDDEDVKPRVLGFTTKYIPGGTLENLTMPFRFAWLRQLTRLVDFLNLEMGIMHQDIAPRNLLIDPDTNNILLFDFDRAARGENGLFNGRDDVAGVVFTIYELITRDTHFTDNPHWERTIDSVQSVSEWPCNHQLDADVSEFRNFLDGWIKKRTTDKTKDIERYLNAPERDRFIWPDLPTAPDYDVPFKIRVKSDGEAIWRTGVRYRRNALGMGQYCFRWERPPQSRLLNKAKAEATSVVDEE